MAEEITIRKIILSPHRHNSTVDNVIRLLRDLTPTEKIHLVLEFMNINGFRFSETVELRELILQKKSNIHHLEVFDCLEFFIQFLLANNGETTHFLYSCTTIVSMHLEKATKLSNAIRSNNNNNGNIESFIFSGFCDSSQVFQPVWDALLLTTGVQELKLFIHFLENNDVNGGNNIDFSNISTNTSLKELEVGSTLCGTNLFESIKGNTTVEKLTISSQYGAENNFDKSGKKAFLEMLVNNTTLRQVELKDKNGNPLLREEINIHTTVNQVWQRLLIIKRKERMADATAAAISTTTPNVAIIITVDDTVEKNKKMAEEKKMMKKKKEMLFYLKTFHKPLMRNELIFSYLTENADMYNVH